MTDLTPTDFYQTWFDGKAVHEGLDVRRVPFEVRWAVENADDPILLDLLGDGLTTEPDEATQEIVVFSDGAEVARFDAFRLFDVDWEAVAAHLEREKVAELDAGRRDVLSGALAVLRDEPGRVTAPPDCDWVEISLHPDGFVCVHRRHGVSEWPESCERWRRQAGGALADYDGL